jgi:hypothetical protein
MQIKNKISLVVPVFNEQDSIKVFYERTHKVLVALIAILMISIFLESMPIHQILGSRLTSI